MRKGRLKTRTQYDNMFRGSLLLPALSSADSYLNRFLHDCGLSFSGEFVEKSKMK